MKLLTAGDFLFKNGLRTENLVERVFFLKCLTKGLIKLEYALFCGAVVQLVRIPACHAGGRGFEPRPLRQSTSAILPKSAARLCKLLA